MSRFPGSGVTETLLSPKPFTEISDKAVLSFDSTNPTYLVYSIFVTDHLHCQTTAIMASAAVIRAFSLSYSIPLSGIQV